ncbi:exopolysaccharide biosynthesis polyprenyl glycosylphosphotransferase [Pontibacter virosus]|uniref:Putative colanic acid biosynthesis UDP-glucose lipid carrier transferase n=1 Tax=Pontibacter virosus TaxID=1765052 RepID=A0A2U1AJV7_9BACT|nr:exopolysaccharide biosynthesis polyprenyl glycosylphosphotransferase [Pontibacter virosus]PVY36670.1 putative colanic acid biosynthesis UDP-glucose lipid carrier transferase [Pontibacter virosus]
MIKHKYTQPSIYFGGDIITLLISIIISVFLFSEEAALKMEMYVIGSLILFWILIGYWRNKNIDSLGNTGSRTIFYIKAYLLMLLLILVAVTTFNLDDLNKNVVIAFVISLPIVGIPVNYFIIRLKRVMYSAKKSKHTLVAGIGNLAVNVEKDLISSKQHYVQGFIKCKNEDCLVSNDKVVGDLSNIQSYLKDNPVDEIVIAIPVKASKKIRQIIAAADYHGVRVKYVPDFQNLLGSNYKITRYGHIEAINVRQLPLDDKRLFFIKNTFDKVFSLVALILLAPLFLILATLIKLESRGPIFYCPVRIGRSGKPFKVFKFRSMKENDASIGGQRSTIKEDSRITSIGRIMRKYSLDELPQFMNVLLGDMSVVGPRPHRSFLNQQFQESVDKYMIRHYFKPGITGWAQVNGWRGPTDTEEQKCMRTKFDLWYVENWTLMLDLKIIWLTIFGREVYKNAF